MNTVHLSNTNFEFELRQKDVLSIQKGLGQHPVFLQLQFMPFLYADTEDTVLVTHQPPSDYWDRLLSLGWWDSVASFPKAINLDLLKKASGRLMTWGWSRQVAHWASEHGISYPIPPWEMIQKVNSKAFSFKHGTPLPGSCLLNNDKQLSLWLAKRETSLVLKSCFGVSGRGKFLIPRDKPIDENSLHLFCKKEWEHGLPIIGEPWVERVFDFSTQWKIEPENEIRFIGATVMQNSALGAYQGTLSGSEELIFREYLSYLNEHKKSALMILEKMQKEGFYGNVGVDAMVYRKSNLSSQLVLHPIVEVNARQTMSLIALWIQRRHFPNQAIKMSYASLDEKLFGLLPNELEKENGSKITFIKQLFFERI